MAQLVLAKLATFDKPAKNRHMRPLYLKGYINGKPLTKMFVDGGAAVNMMSLLTVNSCIKVRLDLQADKSPVVVKGPFFPPVVNPRYRIRGTMCNARIQSSKAR
jgi:hypothetical protein